MFCMVRINCTLSKDEEDMLVYIFEHLDQVFGKVSTEKTEDVLFRIHKKLNLKS